VLLIGAVGAVSVVAIGLLPETVLLVRHPWRSRTGGGLRRVSCGAVRLARTGLLHGSLLQDGQWW
ncbi:hypothetical protein O3Q52_35295, partial [Streptomyces sp. ActVer]|uniref:hypothetical protein n=1 Tax=Streptomyces sp. ActVer TaxID=3014558 RepID=UPI0022B570DD